MRIKHVLWLVGNGWIRTSDDSAWLNTGRENILVFDNLRQFSDWAKREEESERRAAKPRPLSVPKGNKTSTTPIKPKLAA